MQPIPQAAKKPYHNRARLAVVCLLFPRAVIAPSLPNF